MGRGVRRRRNRRGGRDALRSWRPDLRHLPELDDEYYATDGLCTHEQVHLADGLVMDNIIECPKHNGRFDYPHRCRQGRAGLRQPQNLPGQGRSRKSPDRHRRLRELS